MIKIVSAPPRILYVVLLVFSLTPAFGQAATIGGFDIARGGQDSFDSGFGGAKTIILDAFPNTTFVSTNVLDSAFLSGIDVLYLGSVKSGAGGSQMAVSALSMAEQNAMVDFVTNGGRAVLLVDNFDFAAGNNSFITPFGLSVAGAQFGLVVATVTNLTHPVTDGPFGMIASYFTGFPGLFITLGPHANSLATLPGGIPTLAVIEPDTLAQGSGGVVFSSDTSALAEGPGAFAQNRILLLNALAFLGLAMTVEEQIEAVIVALESIISANPDTPIADKLEDAKASLETALGELDKSPPDNQAALGVIEGAVGDLEAAVNDGLLDLAQGTDLMGQLADAARQLAESARDEAIERGGDMSVIDEANDSITLGMNLQMQLLFKDAVNAYKDALSKAEGA